MTPWGDLFKGELVAGFKGNQGHIQQGRDRWVRADGADERSELLSSRTTDSHEAKCRRLRAYLMHTNTEKAPKITNMMQQMDTIRPTGTSWEELKNVSLRIELFETGPYEGPGVQMASRGKASSVRSFSS